MKTILALIFSLSIFIVPSAFASTLGTINAPDTIPKPTDTEEYVAGIVRNSISILIIVAFIVDLLWTIFAGFRFITAGGDEKTIGQAWSQIYWGIIGMLVVVGSYAIITLVEHFFKINIISGGLNLPI